MTQLIKETVTTQESTGPVLDAPIAFEAPKASDSQMIEYLIYFGFGVLESLLAFRMILKIMGANPVSGFVSAIYGITQIFILPFEGIFRRVFTQGIETTSVLEPSTVAAIIVYALLAWGVVKLVKVLSGKQQPE